MGIVLLNMGVVAVILMIIFIIACILTIVAIAMIIVDIVRLFKARKTGKRVIPGGLIAGLVMLAVPWTIFAVLVTLYVSDKADLHEVNYSKFREKSINTVIAKDAEGLYDLMADNVVSEEGITYEDVEDFIYTLPSIFKRQYSYDFKHVGNSRIIYDEKYDTPRDKSVSYGDIQINLKDTDRHLYIAFQLGDRNDTDNIGIHYIVYKDGDKIIATLGRSETWAAYPTDEVQQKIEDIRAHEKAKKKVKYQAQAQRSG